MNKLSLLLVQKLLVGYTISDFHIERQLGRFYDITAEVCRHYRLK